MYTIRKDGREIRRIAGGCDQGRLSPGAKAKDHARGHLESVIVGHSPEVAGARSQVFEIRHSNGESRIPFVVTVSRK